MSISERANPETEHLPGDHPNPGNPNGVIDEGRVITSSGEAPTGGIPVGSAADRVMPDDWARRHGSTGDVSSARDKELQEEAAVPQ